MELMLDTETIRNLRLQKSWTQEQLANASGLSLRTVQRAEKGGACSLETTQALAAVFEVTPTQLQVDLSDAEPKNPHRRGRTYGMIGNTLGVVCAYAGISYSFVNGSLTASDAGIWFGSIGLLGGFNCLFISWLSNYFSRHKIGDW